MFIISAETVHQLEATSKASNKKKQLPVGSSQNKPQSGVNKTRNKRTANVNEVAANASSSASRERGALKQLTARRGTLKRKRQLQALISDYEERKRQEDDDHVDIFTSTPFRHIEQPPPSVR